MGERECEQAIHALLPYMGVTSMQSVCIDTLSLLAVQFSDLMWLVMVQLVPDNISSPDGRLLGIKVCVFYCCCVYTIISITVTVAALC